MNNIFDPALIEKYSIQGPRYTSYPTAVQFSEEFGQLKFKDFVQKSNDANKDLSLYAHIPFCAEACYYCACNKTITKKQEVTKPYLQHLEQEIKSVSELIDNNRQVVQLHWGGGTPTYLSRIEQYELMHMFRDNFSFVDDQQGEFSIEIDPRTVTNESIVALRDMGFNRLSFGVQDFDPQVQMAVNRIQKQSQTQVAVEEGRKQGFHSISVDLIYGLPLQSVKSFEQTLSKIIDLSPDRIAIYNYAHLPHVFKIQKKLTQASLPTAEVRLELLKLSIEKLSDAGYVFIGLDHFAKPHDSLVQHQNNGTLYRNFQGYSTFSNCDLFGFGVSSISQVGHSYSQNVKDIKSYYKVLDQGEFPTKRGVELTLDDVIRRAVITEIMCNMRIDWKYISENFSIDPEQYFAQELEKLQSMAQDGLIQFNDSGFSVSQSGRLLVRNVAMIFDRYLPTLKKPSFSKAI